MTDDDKPLMDRWKCLYCGDEQELARGRKPIFCPNPNCGKRWSLEALGGPFSYFTPGRNPKFVPKKLADEIIKDYRFATHRESWTIFNYKEGYYRPDGEATIRELCRAKLGELAKDCHINEVVKHIQDTTFRSPEDFNPPINLICLENGVYDLNTSELKNHTPDLIFLGKLPTTYNPRAKAPVCGKYFGEWMSEDDVIRAIQFIGFALYREYFIRKVLITYGEGGNAKTTFINYLIKWLGEENTCSIPVQDLDRNRFAVARLYGRYANLCDDLPSSEWFQTGRFKQATGGGQMEGENKFKNPFPFVPYAKMGYTANKLPIVSDDTRAFWERIMLISFPTHFDGSTPREKIWAEMLTPEERSGMLNAALVGLRMLQRRGDFYKPENIELTRSRYKHMSDPVVAFAEDCVTESTEENISKNQLYSEYCRYCKEHGFAPSINSAFSKMLKRVMPNIREGRLTIEGERARVWYGIRLLKADEVHETLNEQTTLPTPSGVQDVQDVQEILSFIMYGEKRVVLNKRGKIPDTLDTLDTSALPSLFNLTINAKMLGHVGHPETPPTVTEPTVQPELVKIREIRAEHINKFIQTGGFTVSKGEGCFDIQDVDWVKDIEVLDAPLRVDPGWRSSHPLKCVCNQGCAGVSLGSYVAVAGTLRVKGPPVKLGDLFKPYDGELFSELSTVFNKFLEVNHVKARYSLSVSVSTLHLKINLPTPSRCPRSP